MVYIVLPSELSKRSIQILIQYMYSGEATVSNDILNEVLHGGELLKIRGLWRNKTPPNESNINSINTQYMPTAEAKSTKVDNDGCLYGDKPLSYEHHPIHERNANNLSIIKESPVIVTSPSTHKSLSSTQHQHMHETQPPPPPMHHLHHTSSHSKSSSSHNELINTHLHPPPPPPPPPPLPLPSLPTQSQTIQLAQSHSTHDLQHNSNIIVKKELAISANDEMSISGNNIPASHYGLVSLQIAAAAVKKAQQNDKRMPKATNENGNAQYQQQQQQQISRRYSDDNYLYARDANDVPSGSHVSQQHIHHHRSVRESDHTNRLPDKSRPINHLKQSRPMTQHSIDTMVESNVSLRKTSLNEQSTSPNTTSETIRMLSIKQEPVEWTDFEHDNNLMEKPNIEVNVKPELVYSKDGSEEEGMSCQVNTLLIHSFFPFKICYNFLN